MATSRYVIVGLVYGAIIEAAIGNTPTQLNRVSMVRHLIGVVQPVLGDFRVGIGGPLAVEPLSASASSIVLVSIAAGMLALTALLFSVRELAGGAARDA
jgi:hypothetical protein